MEETSFALTVGYTSEYREAVAKRERRNPDSPLINMTPKEYGELEDLLERDSWNPIFCASSITRSYIVVSREGKSETDLRTTLSEVSWSYKMGVEIKEFKGHL